MTNQKINVVVVDDHPAVRRGTCEMVEESLDFKVVASGADGEAALTLVACYQPDVLLIDIHMPRRDGISVVRELREKNHELGILMLTAAEEESAILDALRAGANGYLLKTATEEEIHRAIRMVMAGETAILQPEVARALAGSYQRPKPKLPLEPLSEREVEVLKTLAKDLSNKEIAARLSISDRTVQQHMANIFGKLGASSRTGAVLKALQLDVLTLEDTRE